MSARARACVRACVRACDTTCVILRVVHNDTRTHARVVVVAAVVAAVAVVVVGVVAWWWCGACVLLPMLCARVQPMLCKKAVDAYFGCALR